MGLKAELIKIAETAIKILGGSPGQTVTIKGVGIGGSTVETEVYQSSGIFSRPPKNCRGIFLPIGEGRNNGATIAFSNYQITFEIIEGETVIYSSSQDGKTIKAKIYLDNDGNVNLNGSSKHLVTHAELQTALDTLTAKIATHVHAFNGSPSPTLAGLSCNIGSAKAEKVRTS